MKKTIVVADRDESLQHAFMTVFSKAHFDIIHASNGKEVERIAERMNPDVYIVNVDLPKVNGIEVYKRLQKEKFLETASFFFLKDESDTTELLGYQADGVIEKPINFFRVYETVTKEDDAVELTELVEEKQDVPAQGPVKDVVQDLGAPAGVGTPPGEPEAPAPTEPDIPTVKDLGPQSFDKEVLPIVKEQPAEDLEPGLPPSLRLLEQEVKAEITPKTEAQEEVPAVAQDGLSSTFGARLKDAMESLGGTGSVGVVEKAATPAETSVERSELEARTRSVLTSVMEEAAPKLSAQLAPILSQYVEDYVKHTLLEIAERVIREEIDKLLKESA